MTESHPTVAHSDEPPDLWTEDRLAAYTGKKARTIRKWVATGYGPRPVRIGRSLRWRPADVAAWVDEQATA